MSTIKSVGGDPSTQARFRIEYKRPTALLLLTILTLFPSPSPLFYITCLPAFILLHRHNRSLFIIYSPICVGAVTLAADLREGRELVLAGVHSLLVASAIIGIVAGHHRLLPIQRVAWVECLLFGLLWSGCGLTFRVLHRVSYMDSEERRADQQSFLNPSSARYESLRYISRNLGDIGIHTLLSTTAYAIFMVIEVFFPSPSLSRSAEDGRLWEWIKMQPLDKDPSVLESIWSDTSTIHDVQSPPRSSFSYAASVSERSRLDSQAEPSISYGTLTSRNDLIDLESGRIRTYSVFSLPSVPNLGEDTISTSLPHQASSTADSTDTDATLVPSETTIGDALLASILATRLKQPKYLTHICLALLFIWAIILCQPLPEQASLSAPLMEHTPLSVACIIPPANYTSSNLIHLSQTVSGRVKLIVWPEIVVGTEWNRDVLVEEIHQAIGVQYGVFTLISVFVDEIGVKEQILVGSDGGVRAGQGGMDWTALLPP